MHRRALHSVFKLVLLTWLFPGGAQAGDPAFLVGSTYHVAASYNFVQTQDLNHDGATDLVVCDRLGSNISVWHGSGDGHFAFQAAYPVVGGPYSATIYDANTDSHPDIAACMAYPGAYQILLNDGQGEFTVLPPVTGIPNLSSIAHGDFGTDGIQDLLIFDADTGASDVHHFRGLGDGTYQFVAAYSIGDRTSVHNLVVADFNADSHLDVAAATTNGCTVSLLFGHSDDTFTVGPLYHAPTLQALNTIHGGDLNGDGLLDLVSANNNSHGYAIFLNNPSSPGTFLVHDHIMPGWQLPFQCEVLDCNLDDIADVVVCDYGTNQVIFLIGEGDGTFTESPVVYSLTSPMQPIAADVNNDGARDLLIGRNTGDLTVLLAPAPLLPTPCFSFDTDDEGLQTFEYDGFPGYQAALIPLLPASMMPGDTLSFSFEVEEGAVPTEFGTGTSIGLSSENYSDFLGLALVYDDHNFFRIQMSNGVTSGALFQGEPGIVYTAVFTYDGTLAHLRLNANGFLVHTDALPYSAPTFDRLRLGIDYPGQAICGPVHYWWDSGQGRVSFCVDRDTGAYLRGWIDSIITPGCRVPPCHFDFAASDGHLQEFEYPASPGYQSAKVPVTPGTLVAGDILDFKFKVLDGVVPTDFGTGTSMGLGSTEYTQFLGVALVYDDQIAYRVRLVANGSSSLTDFTAAIGTEYRARIEYDGTSARLTLFADSHVMFTDQVVCTPLPYDHFRMGIDYPGQALCGPTHYWWNSAQQWIEFCVDRDTGAYLHGWIDDIFTPGCPPPPPPYPCWLDFNTSAEGMESREYPEGPGYASARVPVAPSTMAPGDLLDFTVKVTDGAVPTDFGASTSIGLGAEAYGDFLGVALVYDDHQLYRIHLAANGAAGQDFPAYVGLEYRVRITFDGAYAYLDLTEEFSSVFRDTLAYQPRPFDHFRLGVDYPGQAICGPEHFWWNQQEGQAEFCVDRDTGAYLRGRIDNIRTPGCSEEWTAPCEAYDFRVDNPPLEQYTYPGAPDYASARIPVGAGIVETPSFLLEFQFSVTDGAVPTSYGTGTSIGLGGDAYADFLGVALVYDDGTLYRVHLTANSVSGADFTATPGVTYKVSITWDGSVADLMLYADGALVFTDQLPYTPAPFNHFRMGIDYPGQAICGPIHYAWNEVEERIDFCVDRDTGAYLRGWIDNVLICRDGVMEVIPASVSATLQMSVAPNPFSRGTVLSFALPSAQHATLAVFDASGRLVRKLLDENLDAGTHRISWDGRTESGMRPAGVYFARLNTHGAGLTTKVIVLK